MFLQVRFVDASKGLDDDSGTTKKTGFQSSMFAGGTLAVILAPNYDPLKAVVTIVSSRLRNTIPSTSDLVSDLVHFAVLAIDSAY